MFDWLRDLRKSAEIRREERTIAYVDGQLSDDESRLFEQEMASDSALRADVAQLRRVKSTLREIPRQRVPRNFTLDPADLRQARASLRRTCLSNLARCNRTGSTCVRHHGDVDVIAL